MALQSGTRLGPYEITAQIGAMEPTMRDWGEDGAQVRGAGVKDPWGNRWFLAGPQLDTPSN